ncbi:MAG: anaerobic ribonucleoside-triphosphate reductase activating protein [Clostridiales bacterium]
MKIQIAGLVNDSIVDGVGLRYGVYVQGCPHGCKGCHNPKTHDFNCGKTMDTDEIWEAIAKNPLLDGVTFSGGEPMCQPIPLKELAVKAKAAGLNIWVYSGYTWEKLLTMGGDVCALLQLTDILVDGAFIEGEKSLELRFKGSKNQRTIDVQKSLTANKIVLADI